MKVYEDTGFEGHAQAGVEMIRPQKKPKGKELTKRQKAANRRKSQKRIVVEHCMGHVKVYRILKDSIRIRKEDARDKVMEVCCAIANFKINFKT